MDSDDYVMTCHIEMVNNINLDEITQIKSEMRKIIKTYGIDHSTIEFDSQKSECEYKKC